MIELRQVSKRFGGKVAVDQLTLHIRQGEFFAFLGPNGAGKTTTLKMIAGLLKPTSGEVYVCGRNINTDAVDAKKFMAYVPDQPFLYDKLSGLEFLSFVGTMYDIPQSERTREIDRLVDLFSMRDFIQELTETYSHGMKQRVVLAATLLHKPNVIIVDEPLVGLDPHTARLVIDIFKEEKRKGTTIFMSTHIISVAEEAADRIGIIMNGRILAEGSMEDLHRQSQTGGHLEEVFFKLTEGNGHNGPSNQSSVISKQ